MTQYNHEATIDPMLVPAVEKAITNRNTKKPKCPLCAWQGNALPWDGSTEILSKVKRHIRTNHRGYYSIASKPYVIKEETDVLIPR